MKILISIALFLIIGNAAVGQDSLYISKVSQMLNHWDSGTDLFVEGNRLYASTGSTGLHILDISDPSNPVEIGSFLVGYGAGKTVVEDGIAFIESHHDQIWIYDVTEAENPVFMDSMSSRRGFSHIDVQNQILYLSENVNDRYIFRIFDVSDPAHKRELATVNNLGFDDYSIDGDYLYGSDVSGSPSDLVIYNISDPTDPTFISSLDQVYLGKVRRFGNYLYLPNAPLGQEASLRIIDISDIENPELIEEIPWPPCTEMAVIDTFLLVLQGIFGLDDWNPGINIFDISDARNPDWITHYAGPETMNFGNVATNGEFWFAMANNYPALTTFRYIDERFVFDYIAPTAGRIHDVDLLDNSYAFITISGWKGGIVTVGISNIYQPEYLGFTELTNNRRSNTLRSVIAPNDLIYTAVENGGLFVIDISRPEEPFVSHTSEGSFFDIALGPNHALLAAGSEGIVVFDHTTDPYAPREVARFATSQSCRQIKFDNNIAAEIQSVGQNGDSVIILDASDPGNLERLSGIRAERYHEQFGDFMLQDGMLYLTGDKLNIYDFSDPRNPEQVLSNLELDGEETRIARGDVFQNRFLFRKASGGVTIHQLDFDERDVPSVELTGFYHFFSTMPTRVLYAEPYLFSANRNSVIAFDCGFLHTRSMIASHFPENQQLYLPVDTLVVFSVQIRDVDPDSVILSWIFNGEAIGNGTSINIEFNSIRNHELIMRAIDRTVIDSVTWQIQITERNDVSNMENVVNDFGIYSISPNPFNSSVTITFSTGSAARPTRLSLRIYDLSGRLIADLLSGHLPLTPPASGGGKYSVAWDSGDMPAGIYIVRLQYLNNLQTAKIVHVR